MNNVCAEVVPWSAVCFHAQQAAEKYLKAALVACGLTPPYTHDLTDLLTRAADIAPSLAAFVDEADLLSVYAVDIRYPDFVGIVTADDGREALRAARKIKDGVIQLLPGTHTV
jgi:HEPN domain-containing protein